MAEATKDRIAGKIGPVRTELKLHGNPGNNSHGKIESENLGPKPGGLIVLFITRPQRGISNTPGTTRVPL